MRPVRPTSLAVQLGQPARRALALLWVAGLALVWLMRADAWLWPVQFVQLLGGVTETLRLQPGWREFAVARAADFAVVLAILAGALPVGVLLVGRFLPATDMLGALYALAAGLWVMAVAVLGVGWFSVENVPWVFAAAAAWLLPGPRRFVGRFYVRAGKLDGWTKLLVVCVVVAALLNLPAALLPPFEYDELEYHLGAPAEYMRAGRIVLLPHNFYSNLPQLTEMLYLLGMVTRSDIAAKLLHWTFGVLAAMAVYAVAARLWSRAAGVWAAGLFYCVPHVQDLGQTARIDLATTFFGALAFGGLLLWSEQRAEQQPASNRWLWLSALAAGAAVATKWTAIAVVVLPALVFVGVIARSVRLPLGYGALAAALAAPWTLKNWLLAGNPVYPLFYKWFPSPHWSEAQARLFAQKHYPVFGWDSVAEVFQRLWQFSVTEPLSVPVLLMSAPLVLVAAGRLEPAAKRASGLFLAGYAGWFLLTFRPWRFLMPALPVAAWLGAYALQRPGTGRAVRAVVCAVLLLSLLRLAMTNLVDAEDYKIVPPRMTALHYLSGQVDRREFVARMGGGMFEPIVWMNENLPSHARVLYLGEARVYYERFAVLWSTAFDQHPLRKLAAGATSAAELAARLREAGVTHIYINPHELSRLGRGYGYLRELDWRLIEQLLAGHAEVLHEHRAYAVYALRG